MKHYAHYALTLLLFTAFPANAFDLKSFLGVDSKAHVVVSVMYNDENCKRDEPLLHKIYNGSRKTVTKTYYSIAGRWPGRSDRVLYSDDSTVKGYSSDYILRPGQQVSYCRSPAGMLGMYRFQKKSYGDYDYESLKKLEWTASVNKVETE